MKISRGCTGMLSSEDNDIKFLKTENNIKAHAARRPEFRARETVLFL